MVSSIALIIQCIMWILTGNGEMDYVGDITVIYKRLIWDKVFKK